MRKIFKFPILILTALSINNVYAAAKTDDPIATPTAKPLVKALQLSDLHTKPLMDQLLLVKGATLTNFHVFLGTEDSNFNQILFKQLTK